MQFRRKVGHHPVIAVGVLVLVFALFFPLVAFGQSTLTGVVTRDANLRTGPGTNYPIAGKATVGQTVQIIGKSTAGDWYQLENKTWIASFLVKISVTTATPTPVLGNTGTLTATTTLTPPLTTTLTTTLPTTATTVITPALANKSTITPTKTAPTTLVRQLAKVTSINNGDTIHVSLNGKIYKVRYLLISAPTGKQPLYNESTEANRQLVKDKSVYLVKDISDTDSEGNLLRYIYLQNGTFVNAELVRRGYALMTTFTSDLAKAPEILAAQQEAINAKRGLWAAQLPTPAPVIANHEGNLRACSSTNCAIIGHVTASQTLELIGRNADKTWYQLAKGGWIAALLVSNPPSNLPVVTPKVAAPKATPLPTKPTPTPTH